MSKPFYQLLKEYKEVEELLEYDEVTDELIERLTINKSELEEKTQDLIGIDNYYQVQINKCLVERDFYKSEIERIDKETSRIEKKKNRVRNFIFDAVKLFGKANKTGNLELQVGTYKLRVGTTKSVDITDIELIPYNFVNYEITDKLTWEDLEPILEGFDLAYSKKADKAKIKKNIEDGFEIEGAEIVEKETLYIK